MGVTPLAGPASLGDVPLACPVDKQRLQAASGARFHPLSLVADSVFVEATRPG
jgi:hypothetical protein